MSGWPRRAARLPKARRFAVARMDPAAMVAHLEDPVALRAARAMKPKKYLVYLEFPQDLAMPDSEWCRYRISPVASTPRPPVPEKGITPDMVIPIYPNTDNPKGKGHVSVRPTPTFPFSNCCFWIESRMSLRVRVDRERGYDNDRAYQLDLAQHIAFTDGFEQDFAAMSRYQRKFAERPTSSSRRFRPQRHSAQGPWVTSSVDDMESDDDYALDDLESESQSDSGRRCGRSPSPTIPPSITDLLSLNLFGWDDDPSFQYIPLVDIWLDIAEHLTEDTIPSPAELWKEQEEIFTIIEDSVERQKQERLTAWSLLSSAVSHTAISYHSHSLVVDVNGNYIHHGAHAVSSLTHMSKHARPSTSEEDSTSGPFALTYAHRSWSGDLHSHEMVPLVDTARGPSLEKSKPPMAHEADPLSYLTLASPQPRKRPLPELTWGGQVPSAQPTSPPYELLGLTELRPPAMAQMLPQPLSKPDRPLSALPVYKEKATPPPSYADVVKKDPRPSSGANVVAWPRQSSSTSLAGSSTMSVRSTAWLRPPYSLQSATRASVSYSSSSYTYEGRVQTEEGRFHRVLPVTAHNAAQQRKMAEHARREAERMRLAAARQQHRRRNEPEPVLELVQRVAASIHDGASKAGKPEREAMRNIEQAPSRGKGMKTRRDSKPVGGRPPRRGRSGHGGSSGRGGLTPRSRTRPLPMQV